ncbi:hypothetical protein QO012_002070 [Methylobacterium aerolatum]|uniref:Uncharacterized protein n=1 Tax=Methylobacterium aerolatum TaxID=418708 RepID=A0ABU0HZ22_9HYPH|nr:hypothetical protein [Methylobacterium aerolatum]
MVTKSLSYLMIGLFASGLVMTAMGVVDVIASH